MAGADFIARLERFEGPLDLLLHLIKRAEVDVADIPIAAITEQYLEHLKGIERIDIDVAGEFLVMAATLMEIKSRMIAPAPEGGEGEAGEVEGIGGMVDPRAELVQQLLAYKRVRDAALALESRREEWERRYPSGGAAAAEVEVDAEAPAEVDLEDLSLYDLVRAFARIVETVDLDRALSNAGAHAVTYDDTPIELHAADIVDRLRRGGGEARLTLREILAGRGRGEMIGLFLALLELIRRREVTAERGDGPEEVAIRLGEGAGAKPTEG